MTDIERASAWAALRLRAGDDACPVRASHAGLLHMSVAVHGMICSVRVGSRGLGRAYLAQQRYQQRGDDEGQHDGAEGVGESQR